MGFTSPRSSEDLYGPLNGSRRFPYHDRLAETGTKDNLRTTLPSFSSR